MLCAELSDLFTPNLTERSEPVCLTWGSCTPFRLLCQIATRSSRCARRASRRRCCRTRSTHATRKSWGSAGVPVAEGSRYLWQLGASALGAAHRHLANAWQQFESEPKLKQYLLGTPLLGIGIFLLMTVTGLTLTHHHIPARGDAPRLRAQCVEPALRELSE